MVTRRQILVSGAVVTGGLLVGLTPRIRTLERRLVAAPPLGEPGWILIRPDDSVRLYCTLTEMGQGAWSALAQILNEELEADPARIVVEAAPCWRAYAAPVGFFTGGSTSVERMFTPMRSIGAAARSLLITAAANRWRVPLADCRASQGHVVQITSGRRASYGKLAAAATRLRAPIDPPLKPRAAWRSIGRSLPQLETASLVDGTAAYGLDVRLPGMLYAAVSQSPWPGGQVDSIDRAAARRGPGVVGVVELGETVTVIGRDSWSALQGLTRAAIAWRSPAEVPDTEPLSATLRRHVEPPAVRQSGAAPDRRTVRALYEAPLLMHAQLEPLNATAHVHRLSAELWAPTQVPAATRDAVAEALLVLPEAVAVHVTRAGGAFGRHLTSDEGVTAARIAREVGAPVKAIWSREEDSLHDDYRPMAAARLEARLDASGFPEQLNVEVASLGEAPRTDGLDPVPYRVRDAHVNYTGLTPPIRIGFWRSVNASQNVFFRECFIDECAHAGGSDPLEYRVALLGPAHARGRRVLAALAEASRWHARRAPNLHLGLAYHEGFGSIASQAVELSHEAEGGVRIERIVVVADCGTVVNPANVRAQLEGGTLFALSAALREEVTLERGRLRQRNFDTYRVLRIAETPPIEVHLLETPEAPVGGIGEVAVPPLAPALVNALYAATGARVRRLPLSHAGIRWAHPFRAGA